MSEELKSKIKRNFWLIVLLSLAAISAYCGLLLAKSISQLTFGFSSLALLPSWLIWRIAGSRRRDFGKAAEGVGM